MADNAFRAEIVQPTAKWGIDVRAYVQQGAKNIVRASCVGCGHLLDGLVPGGVELENGPF